MHPASWARRLTTLRSFFRWARASRLILANPATGIRAGRARGYHPRTLAVAEQRRLFRRWTTEPAVHPHEALTGPEHLCGTAAILPPCQDVPAVAFSPNGKTLATGVENDSGARAGPAIRVWLVAIRPWHTPPAGRLGRPHQRFTVLLAVA